MTDKIGWPSAVVAVALILLIAGVQIAAIQKYSSVDEALKFVANLSSVVGLFAGAFVTYFFTKPAREEARKEKAEAVVERKRADNSLKALVRTVGQLDPQAWTALQRDPSIQAAIARE
jgi:hypothetical protein